MFIVVTVYTESMSIYRRRNREFEDRLSIRNDELKSGIVTKDEQGKIILSALPYLQFPTQASAEQFLRRVTRNTRGTK